MTSSNIRSLKTPPLSPAMNELLGMIDSFTGGVTPEQLEPAGLQVWIFHNDYPTFTDTNNLSLLTFLDVGGVSFVLGGDLEKAGWLALLQNPHVQGLLQRVDVFVASHHGRESGYCPEVFEYCTPRLIVMSDGPIRHDTQLMASTYAQHALGELFFHALGPRDTQSRDHEEGWKHKLGISNVTLSDRSSGRRGSLGCDFGLDPGAPARQHLGRRRNLAPSASQRPTGLRSP